MHSLRLNRERVSTLYLPLQSNILIALYNEYEYCIKYCIIILSMIIGRWAYIGTDKGNTYLICLATFELSSYVINWNKAVDLSCKVHPGSIQILSICPSEQSKLLVVFKKGIIRLKINFYKFCPFPIYGRKIVILVKFPSLVKYFHWVF